MTAPAATPPSLVIAEIFGPTFQGEGPSIGRRCSFIRLGGCNLTCSWCDTAYTWNAKRYDLRTELTRVPVADICAQVEEHNTDMVVITGGEPLLHQGQRGWEALLYWLHRRRYRVEVETNGTIAPTSFTARHVTQFNVSPKLAHAGDPEARRIRPAALAALRETGRAVFKFVCTCPADVYEAFTVVKRCELSRRDVWIMPEGRDDATITATARKLADLTRGYGFNLTLRQHVTVWGDKRGH